ncbi:MAG: winged helix-turn-helix transcriptional regulator [Actinobacteria bacterium]|nr:MAG: winged helix-turn-helix transcriptional regulator [Actinomycetota bacterium]
MDAETATGTLLLHVFQSFERALFDRLAKRGHAGLRPKHGAVLANVDASGTRGSVLARRAGMTQPAMGELVDELEAKGYVRRVPDPADRRAKLVVPTARALARQRIVVQVVDAIEREYRDLLGSVAYESLRAALMRLVEATGSGYEVRQPRPLN